MTIDEQAQRLSDVRDSYREAVRVYRERLAEECEKLPWLWHWSHVSKEMAVIAYGSVDSEMKITMMASGAIVAASGAERLTFDLDLLNIMRTELGKHQ